MKLRKSIDSLRLISAIFLIDRLTKLTAVKFFEVVCNKGSVLGLLELNIFLYCVLLIAIFWILVNEKDRVNVFGMGLIFAGGISNLIDRILYGCVVDFINIGTFPVFNISDAIITFGALAVFVRTFGFQNEKD